MKRTPQTGMGTPPSKTRRKQESRSLQALGEALIKLKPEELEGLELPGRLSQALDEARHISKHGALRRQRQFVGRLMRDIDPGPIREFLDRRQAVQDRDSRLFRDAESWRRRLLEGDAETLRQCATALGITEQTLSERVAAVSTASSEPLRKGASRALFRYLHDSLRALRANEDQ